MNFNINIRTIIKKNIHEFAIEIGVIIPHNILDLFTQFICGQYKRYICEQRSRCDECDESHRCYYCDKICDNRCDGEWFSFQCYIITDSVQKIYDRLFNFYHYNDNNMDDNWGGIMDDDYDNYLGDISEKLSIAEQYHRYVVMNILNISVVLDTEQKLEILW